MRDFNQHAKENNLDFILEVGEHTKLSKTLKDLDKAGEIKIRRIGDTLNSTKSKSTSLPAFGIVNGKLPSNNKMTKTNK